MRSFWYRVSFHSERIFSQDICVNRKWINIWQIEKYLILKRKMAFVSFHIPCSPPINLNSGIVYSTNNVLSWKVFHLYLLFVVSFYVIFIEWIVKCVSRSFCTLAVCVCKQWYKNNNSNFIASFCAIRFMLCECICVCLCERPSNSIHWKRQHPEWKSNSVQWKRQMPL